MIKQFVEGESRNQVALMTARLDDYIYRYLNPIQSSRRLERETQRNVELMWFRGQLSPDFKTIADFCHDYGKAFRNVCERFVALDPDRASAPRPMASSGRGVGMVGYNVQTSVETLHHFIVAHEVTNVGYGRTQLAKMAFQSREALAVED